MQYVAMSQVMNRMARLDPIEERYYFEKDDMDDKNMVIAATDVDLARAAETGRYRGPLYYRLAGMTLRTTS